MIKHAAEKFNSRPYLNSSLRIILALMPIKEFTRPTSFPGSRSFDPNPNSDRVPVTTIRTNKSRDNKIELGTKNPERFSSRRTELLEPGFDSHSESPSQEKPWEGKQSGWGVQAHTGWLLTNERDTSIYSDKSVTKKGRNITVIIAVIMTPINNNNWFDSLIKSITY